MGVNSSTELSGSFKNVSTCKKNRIIYYFKYFKYYYYF